MDLEQLPLQLRDFFAQAELAFQKVPGSAVLVRYIRSSYQNDPVRSAIELVLVLFFIRYLLSPSYSTHKQNYVKLNQDVTNIPHRVSAFHGTLTDCVQEIEELIEDWTPEPLVAEPTPIEQFENEKLPVIIG